MALELDWDLVGLGAFLFAATLMGQMLASRREVDGGTWFLATFAWGVALGGFAALSVEQGELVWRLAAAAGSGAAAFLTGTVLTWFLAQRGWLEDRREINERRFRQEIALLGGAIAAATGALAGGAGGFGTSGTSLVTGFFAPLALGFVAYILGRRSLPRQSLLLAGPNIAAGAAWGGLIGPALIAM